MNETQSAMVRAAKAAMEVSFRDFGKRPDALLLPGAWRDEIVAAVAVACMYMRVGTSFDPVALTAQFFGVDRAWFVNEIDVPVALPQRPGPTETQRAIDALIESTRNPQ